MCEIRCSVHKKHYTDKVFVLIMFVAVLYTLKRALKEVLRKRLLKTVCTGRVRERSFGSSHMSSSHDELLTADGCWVFRTCRLEDSRGRASVLPAAVEQPFSAHDKPTSVLVSERIRLQTWRCWWSGWWTDTPFCTAGSLWPSGAPSSSSVGASHRLLMSSAHLGLSDDAFSVFLIFVHGFSHFVLTSQFVVFAIFGRPP